MQQNTALEKQGLPRFKIQLQKPPDTKRRPATTPLPDFLHLRRIALMAPGVILRNPHIVRRCLFVGRAHDAARRADQKIPIAPSARSRTIIRLRRQSLQMRAAIERRECRHHRTPASLLDLAFHHHAARRRDKIWTDSAALRAFRRVLIPGGGLGQLVLKLRNVIFRPRFNGQAAR